MYVRELTETEMQGLERKFQKEISDYQNKIICKEKFIYIIKKCNLIEFCYLYQTYIGKIEVIGRIPEFILEDNNFIEAIETTNTQYNNKPLTKNHSNKMIKELIRIEKMVQKRQMIGNINKRR